MAMTRRSVAELNIGELECRNRCLAGREGFKARLVAQAPHYNSKQNIGELDTKAMLKCDVVIYDFTNQTVECDTVKPTDITTSEWLRLFGRVGLVSSDVNRFFFQKNMFFLKNTFRISLNLRWPPNCLWLGLFVVVDLIESDLFTSKF